MIADIALTLFDWGVAIVAVLWSGTLLIAWINGLLDRHESRRPAATNPKDRSK